MSICILFSFSFFFPLLFLFKKMKVLTEEEFECSEQIVVSYAIVSSEKETGPK